MKITRRPVLLGLAATGAAAAISHFAATDLWARPMAAVIAGSPYDSAFLDGIQAARAAARQPDATLVPLAGLDADGLARIRDGLDSRAIIVGLTDDAVAAVVAALARSAGASQLWQGQHGVSGADAWAASLGFTLGSRPGVRDAARLQGWKSRPVRDEEARRFASLVSFSFKV